MLAISPRVPSGLEPRPVIAAGTPRPRRSLPRWLASLAAWLRWRRNENCLRALAAVDDDELCHLSEAGQELRRRARHELDATHPGTSGNANHQRRRK